MKAMKVRFWGEMLAIVGLIACAAALVIATVGGTAGAAAGEPESAHAAEPRQSLSTQSSSTQSSSGQSSSGQSSSGQSSSGQSSSIQSSSVQSSSEASPPQPQNYDGVITDTRCGAKHSAAIGQSAADCTRACVHSGERFALVDGDRTYALEGESEALKHAAGERVRIVGTLSGSTISVASVRAPAP
jgi:hypothetical protein